MYTSDLILSYSAQCKNDASVELTIVFVSGNTQNVTLEREHLKLWNYDVTAYVLDVFGCETDQHKQE